MGIAETKVTTTHDADEVEANEKTNETEDVSIDAFYVENSKSNRSKCRKCDNKIEKVYVVFVWTAQFYNCFELN